MGHINAEGSTQTSWIKLYGVWYLPCRGRYLTRRAVPSVVFAMDSALVASWLADVSATRPTGTRTVCSEADCCDIAPTAPGT